MEKEYIQYKTSTYTCYYSGLMVKVGEEKYAIALGSIETIEDVPVSEIKYVHAKEVINLRGNVIPLIR